jgi:hypothetical protein
VREEISQLVALQAKDSQCAGLDAQLKRLEQARVRQTEAVEERRRKVDEVRQQLSDLERKSRLKNLEVDELDEQIRGYKRQLSEGIISFKEMQALEEKIANQRQRIGKMEDEALELMDDVEHRRRLLKEEEDTFKDYERKAAARDGELSSQLGQLSAEIARCREERDNAANEIPSHFLSRYEGLHSLFKDPVVAVVHGSCSGCKLKLSGNTIERARSSIEIVTCEHCSRILYVD